MLEGFIGPEAESLGNKTSANVGIKHFSASLHQHSTNAQDFHTCRQGRSCTETLPGMAEGSRSWMQELPSQCAVLCEDNPQIVHKRHERE